MSSKPESPPKQGAVRSKVRIRTKEENMPLMTQPSVRVLRNTALWWAGIFAAFLGFVYLVNGVLLPFIAGLVLAYFMDPLADRLEAIGVRRRPAAFSIVVLFAIMFLLVLMLIVPFVSQQLIALLQDLPSNMQRLQDILRNNIAGLEPFLTRNNISLEKGLQDVASQGVKWIGSVAGSIWSGGQALVSVLSLLVITPIVAYYFLIDWDRMVKAIDSHVPRKHVNIVRRLALEIDDVLAGFLRGQATLMLFLAIFYAIGLALIGLNYGIAVGLLAGLLSFIPYAGTTLGVIISLILAFSQFWPEWQMIALVGLVFVIGQFLEGYILAPKLVGTHVGLHPVGLFFALFAFGSLFGFVGLLIAVPSAAAIVVLIKFALKTYKQSHLYEEGIHSTDP